MASAIKARMAKEVLIAAENSAFQKGIMELGTLTPFTCPECHGALVKIAEGKMSRFRCHTGHAYTDNALLESVIGIDWRDVVAGHPPPRRRYHAS